MIITALLGWGIALVSIYVNVRFGKRLFQFDDLFGKIVDPLTAYATDLKEMMGGEILSNSPEIIAFHKRNMQMLLEVNAAREEIISVRPKAIAAVSGPTPEVD